MSKDETKPVEPKPVPTTPRGKLLAHFDEMLEQLTIYETKFQDHLHAMDEEKKKVEESRVQLLKKIEEISTLREYIEKKVK